MVNESKLTLIEIFYFFRFICIAANASQLFCMTLLAYNGRFLYHLTFHFKYEIYMQVNSPALVDENQLKCEKVRFLSEMNGINIRWVIFDL